MKKIISLIMVSLLMVASLTVFAEDEVFSIQGGLTFGMSKQEVIDFEKEKDIEVKRDYGEYGFSAGELYGNGLFADSRFNMWFSFQDDGLSSIVLEEQFGNTSKDYYNQLESTLTEKYGKPVALEEKYTMLPVKGDTAVDLYNNNDFRNFFSGSSKFGSYRGLSPVDFNQHIYQVENGYISIQHLLIGYVFSTSDGSINKYHSVLSYSFVTKEDYDRLINGYNEREEQAEQARNNDL